MRSETPRPSAKATLAIFAGMAITMAVVKGDNPAAFAHDYAVGVGLTLLVSLALDYQGRLRNLVRADIMGLGSLYFLTLFEFLFPQEEFSRLVTIQQLQPAVLACVTGFVGLASGRHLVPPAPKSLQQTLRHHVPPRTIILLYSIALFGGYFHMLLAVNFNVFDLIEHFMGPRFSQPWTRGRFGDWKALFGELGMILYLVPPIAGVVSAQRAEYSVQQRLYVYLGLAFTLFYGFASGTRNVVATYLATFLVAFAFSLDVRKRRELLVVSAITGTVMLVATVVMLEFREIGFRNYLAGYKEIRQSRQDTKFFVDYNLYVIARLTDVFPERHDYLGWEIPYLAVIRPIPRAIWSGKPEGMSLSIEDAVGVEGLTLASSFIGEGYMSGGMTGVFLAGFALAIIAGWWNRFGQPDNSALGHLIFASGFFAVVISMRSLFVFTTAILPTIAALVLGNWLVSRRRQRIQPN